MSDNKDLKDVIVCMFNEHTAHGRHHESQRAIVSSLVITLASALIALIGFDNDLKPNDLPAAIMIVVLGLFGVIFTLKEYERAVFHMNRARLYRVKLENIFPDLSIEDLKEGEAEKLAKSYPFINSVSLKYLWVTLHFSIAVIGGFVATFSIIS
jgi:hypothetical protein